MLRKLSKQQHLLLGELERTKRRLHEEIWSREENNTAAVLSAKPDPLAWRYHPTFGYAKSSKENTNSPARPVSSNKQSPVRNTARHYADTGGASCLKRSRSEAEMSSVDSEAEGAEIARLAVARPPATTMIGMLGVMSSTGE